MVLWRKNRVLVWMEQVLKSAETENRRQVEFPSTLQAVIGRLRRSLFALYLCLDHAKYVVSWLWLRSRRRGVNTVRQSPRLNDGYIGSKMFACCEPIPTRCFLTIPLHPCYQLIQVPMITLPCSTISTCITEV